MLWKSAKTSAFTSILFLVVYNVCNHLSSLRSDVGTWYYQWERHIPFVPLFIIPYMSIDLFFVAAPFLCSDDRERSIFARRITMAILIAGLFFLLMPLRLAVQRPHVEGWLGLIFNPFREMDKPYNLLPSLHIALRTILAELYARHTRGVPRLLFHTWFSLIGLSTLLVYQHHIVDVIGGFLLAGMCFYFVDEAPLFRPVTPNRRIGRYYALGTLAMVGAALALAPWGLWLLWPALSLAMIAGSYVLFGPGIYHKRNGRISFAARLLHGGVLAGQWVSLRHYARQCPPWHALTDRVWIGRKLNASEARELVRQGVTAVLDLTCEFSETKPLRDVHYRNLQVLDLTAPTPAQLDEAIQFIDAESARGIVYIHCKAGYSRTAAVAGSWLRHRALVPGADAALAKLRQIRPTIVIRREAEQAIRSYSNPA